MYNKTQQILIYFIKNNPQIPVTSLMKLSYLADLMSIEKGGEQITDFTYRRYNFGPFDKKLYSYIEKMTSAHMILPQSNFVSSGEYITYTLNEETEKIEMNDISKKEKKILDELISKVGGYGARTLTEIAYKTKPMLALGATIGGKENLNVKLNLVVK